MAIVLRLAAVGRAPTTFQPGFASAYRPTGDTHLGVGRDPTVMKKCLIVAYYFPPGGGVGVLRSMKFAKYLPATGWDPIVVTADVPQGIPRETP